MLPHVKACGATSSRSLRSRARPLGATATWCSSRADRRAGHGLAPSASTTAMRALGDALLVVEGRDFGPDDFARFHPGGDLGAS